MLRVELKASNRAYGNGLSADSIMGLARALMAAGCPDQPFECYRDEVLCLRFKSLAWAARHTIHEEPALKVAKYKSFSGLPVPRKMFIIMKDHPHDIISNV